MARAGRAQPYSERGVKMLRCVRCRRRAQHQWNACADGVFRPVCLRCDCDLNELVLRFMRDPEVDVKMVAYRRRWLGEGR